MQKVTLVTKSWIIGHQFMYAPLLSLRVERAEVDSYSSFPLGHDYKPQLSTTGQS